ncbi:MAG TPA: DUF2892 domain-containing protein [Candidatus Limnocylindria bacterium]|nr:DUF2892 domain-containing protein [Candidatus Limnocylindria bacterium]
MPELPPTERRVEMNTDPKVNEEIREKTRENIRKYEDAGPDAIRARLEELEHEWDTERVLEANASALVVIGSALGFFVSPFWMILPFIVGVFLFQHALQGWCPPLPLIRALGVRTNREIRTEREALQARLVQAGA